MRELRSVFVLLSAVLLLAVLCAPLSAQVAPSSVKVFTQINPPPCDFSDTFYGENGMDITQLVGRFGDNGGTTRLTGPPATGNQVNYVADNNCGINDPTRRNFRILATTGGFVDDETGAPTDFISILAFVENQSAFLQSFSVNGKTFISDSGNARTIRMQDIVSNFEAYAALKQRDPATGKLAPTPCGTMGDSTLPPGTPCFSPASVATPSLRQDWRFATNRNAIDGSDNNSVTGSGSGATINNNTPFGYFCDDLLGMWIITYFWFNENSVGNPATGQAPTSQCTSMLNQLASMHGTSLDGTPIILTGNELNFMEGKDVGTTPLGPGFPTPPSPACMAENQEDPGGADAPASIWLICPAILDPRNGGIAKDAFLDVVRLPNGNAQNTGLLNNFSCLQNTGKFCNEAAPGN